MFDGGKMFTCGAGGGCLVDVDSVVVVVEHTSGIMLLAATVAGWDIMHSLPAAFTFVASRLLMSDVGGPPPATSLLDPANALPPVEGFGEPPLLPNRAWVKWGWANTFMVAQWQTQPNNSKTRPNNWNNRPPNNSAVNSYQVSTDFAGS